MEDSLYKFLRLFLKLPGPVKKILDRLYSILPDKIKYGSFYFEYEKRIKFFYSLDSDETRKEQSALLYRQVNNAIKNIPFYKEFGPYSTKKDFAKFPVINKGTVIDSYDKFVNPDHKNLRIKANTGGSSGTPLSFYLEKNVSRPKEKAHFNWFWGQFGYKPNDPILMIRGMPLSENRLFEYSAINNILNVSCYNINHKNISVVVKEIIRFNPLFIHAYPSSLKILTVLMDNHHFKVDFNLKAIFLGSEDLPDNERLYFEKFYHSIVKSWYGHTERLIHGGNCPFSNEYHFYPFYGYVELLDDNNEPVEQPDVEGRIVATGFDNSIMPFIRYDTGDIGVLSAVSECACGFKGTSFKKIVGRAQNVIQLSDNTQISLTAFIFGQHLHAFKKIVELQIIQEKPGEIEIRIVKSLSFRARDEHSLISTLLSSVDNKLSIKINYVTEIPKTAAGKSIFFISKLNQIN
jgi:phenylacetate-CoA ligase